MEGTSGGGSRFNCIAGERYRWLKGLNKKALKGSFSGAILCLVALVHGFSNGNRELEETYENRDKALTTAQYMWAEP